MTNQPRATSFGPKIRDLLRLDPIVIPYSCRPFLPLPLSLHQAELGGGGAMAVHDDGGAWWPFVVVCSTK